MEIDKSILLDKNITMDDIHFAISQSSYGQDINCVQRLQHGQPHIQAAVELERVQQDEEARGGVAGSDRRDLSVEEFSGHVAKQYRIARRVGISNVSARKIQNAVSKRTEVCHRGHLDSGHDRE
jgi:hypothetical protein